MEKLQEYPKEQHTVNIGFVIRACAMRKTHVFLRIRTSSRQGNIPLVYSKAATHVAYAKHCR